MTNDAIYCSNCGKKLRE
ncbi:MAG TPA: hypothetical protein GX019_10360 [Firmicutes bacterium]|nr:hypothetical protein [Bacillota bacterium]